MLIQPLDECIHRVEGSLDDALRAAQAGPASDELRQTLEMLHQQAMHARASCRGPRMAAADALRNAALQMERTADRAIESSRKADPATQQAVQHAHDEITNLKQQVVVS